MFHIIGNPFDGVFVSFESFYFLDSRQSVKDCLRKLVRFKQFFITIFDPLNSDLIDLNLVDPLGMLIDKLDNFLEKLVERLALKIKTHKITRVMTIPFQYLI